MFDRELSSRFCLKSTPLSHPLHPPSSSSSSCPVTSEPAVGAEVLPQLSDLSLCQRLQRGTRGAAVETKPLHGLFQTGNSQVPGHLTTEKVGLGELVMSVSGVKLLFNRPEQNNEHREVSKSRGRNPFWGCRVIVWRAEEVKIFYE